jgi:hypothetical protein
MNDETTSKFVETEHLRLVMESFSNLQPALSLDRSDIEVKLKEYSLALGKGCNEAKLYISSEDSTKNSGERQHIQQRDLYLCHAVNINRHRITRLGTGEEAPSTLENDMAYLITRSFAQAYGRNTADIMLSDPDLHRSKIKMAQIIVYIPDDLMIGEEKEQLRRMQNSINEALTNVIGTKEKLPLFITTYRVPMAKHEDPLIAVRLMTHAKDVFDLIVEDTPEFFERILSGVAIYEKYKLNRRGRTKMLENKIWNNEIEALSSPRHASISFFRRWSDILRLLKQRIYRKGWHPKRVDAWSNGLGQTDGEQHE